MVVRLQRHQLARLSAALPLPVTSPTRPASPLLRWSVSIILAVVAGALIFQAFDISVFQRIGMAHEYCYLREPRLIWLHVISDLLIGLAYVSISTTLGYLVYKASRDIPFHWVFLAFGLFIVSCGMTHFMEVWVIWEPVYWMSGYVKVVTAAASVATAIALFPLVPKVFRLIDAARQSERRRREIEHLNEELETFNYTVAHDLRAPLRGITGFGQALREDFSAALPPQAVDYIEKMQRSAAQMDTLICDLLKYTTIGRQEITLRPIALDAAIRSTLTLLESEVRARDAVIRVAEPLPTVIADGTLLQLVFLNLLSNAAKFVAPGTRPQVDVTSRVDAGTAIVSITDNGLGLPADSREKLFKMFERFHPGYTGTGIGLAIVQRAIQRLNGRIGAEPGPNGAGTRFWIELPLA
jgi:signal transduction histidine kinase